MRERSGSESDSVRGVEERRMRGKRETVVSVRDRG